VSDVVGVLRMYVSSSEREESDRCTMLRLAQELAQPLSRTESSAHFTASAFVIDESGGRVCLVQHEKLGRLLQPGGHLEETDLSLEAAAVREASEETALAVDLHPSAPRPFDLEIHQIPERPGEPAHWHLDVRYLVIGRGEPRSGAAWHPLGGAGDASVGRLTAKVIALRSRATS
jgi:8-oxo-dGTP pyrophosphatase MutT (NUDIX family)